MPTLDKKSYKQYDYLSRYASFPYYFHPEDKKYIYGITSWLNNTTNYVAHKIKQGDTLDSLSLKYYNTPLYYWVIADFNRICDPFLPLIVGKELKIPTISTLTYSKR